MNLGASEIGRQDLLPWQDGQPLQELVYSHFKACPSTENLASNYGYAINWTHDLSDHLAIDWKYKEITVYEHKIHLFNHLRFPDNAIIPEDIVAEAIDTLNLLFPFQDDATKRFLDKEKKLFYGLGFCNRPRKLDLDDYTFWRDRIEDLGYILRQPAVGLHQLRLDKGGSNMLQISAFWITVVLGLVTLVSIAFAVGATVYGVKQYSISLKQYELAVAEACLDPAMSISDGTDSGKSLERSDIPDTESTHSEFGGSEDMDLRNLRSDTNGRDRVSQSVFLEATEGSINAMLFAGVVVAASVRRAVNTNKATRRPKITIPHGETGGYTSISRPTHTDRSTAQDHGGDGAGTVSVQALNVDQPTAQDPDIEGAMNCANLIRNDLTPEHHAHMPIAQFDSSFEMHTSLGETTATSHKMQTPDTLRALEDKVDRDMSRPLNGQSDETAPNTVARQPVKVPTNTSILGCFSDPLRYMFSRSQIYIPLPSRSHIRVLAIQPGTNDDALVASFKILDLDTPNLPFEAIS
ncbi:uncharacterized protein FIESC28_02725 [Fusarium coffeatum]|uniref:Uncharacterized protein n=1 Tax=Fusarium coffeatum TaxID=231269 RepID=A0A366S5E9_9HYPO|nr:uncharacterized protein FIESC28_02725 [Fusarium coffeatum]RBR24529.1 hypothetical protein FIESC28_02725 [Fusarium coffeatum]